MMRYPLVPAALLVFLLLPASLRAASDVPGDIDGSCAPPAAYAPGCVNLRDVIMGMQLLVGRGADRINPDADVDRDHGIGGAEVVWALAAIAGRVPGLVERGLAAANEGVGYTQYLRCTSGDIEVGALPAWLAFERRGQGLGVLAGTPGHEVVNHTTDGSLRRYEIAAACRGNAGAATRRFALAVHDDDQAFVITRQPE